MGKNKFPALLMAVLLLFAAAAPSAHAVLPIAGDVLKAVTVMGSVCCCPKGHCPDGPPLAGVTVRLICTTDDGGANVTVGEAITGSNGAYVIVVKILENTALGAVIAATIGQTLPCQAVVALPVSQAGCPALSIATGFLAGATTLVNVAVSKVFGVVGCTVVPIFRLIGRLTT